MRRNLAVAALALILSLLIAEGLVRVIGDTSPEGQLTFMGRRIRPYRIPLSHVQQVLDQYAAEPSSYLMADPELGWTLRPNGKSQNGLYQANGQGLRADREYGAAADLRIAVFGDSFTHGDEVILEDSWPYLLETMLREQGVEAEVLNFGVPGYGMDQAYLRWQRDGQEYAPDIVIFGFRSGDALRNMSVFRVIDTPDTGVPFSKPRFDAEMRVINQPTLALDEIVPTLADFGESELAPYDYWYDESYVDHWWLNSKLVAVVITLATENDARMREQFFAGGGSMLAADIIDRFADGVEASDSEFMIVTLPSEGDLERFERDQPFDYAPLLDQLDLRYTVVHSERYFDLNGAVSAYFAGHYSPEGNQVIAAAIFDALSEDGLAIP